MKAKGQVDPGWSLYHWRCLRSECMAYCQVLSVVIEDQFGPESNPSQVVPTSKVCNNSSLRARLRWLSLYLFLFLFFLTDEMDS